MGGALLRGWLASGAVDRPIVVDPARPSLPQGVTVVPDLSKVVDPLPRTIVLAVKPQMMDGVTAALRPRLPRGALVISIAAGKTLDYFAKQLGEAVSVIRTMPNTPASIGRGVSACCPGPSVANVQRETTETLLRAVGDVAWVEDESLMHAVTALSGSGPAYVFLLIEAMAEAGRAAGLPAPLAAQLARATVAGAGELARLSADDPAKLRADVTSPNGTTAAALAVLMASPGLSDLMRRAVEAAAARSAELAAG